MRRRNFLQTITAGLAALSLPVPRIFRKTPKPVAPLTPIQTGLGTYCCYVYNCGIDIDGIRELTFHQHGTLIGGAITKITSREEWGPARRLPEGAAFKTRTMDNRPFGIRETHSAIQHSAYEITANLLVTMNGIGAAATLKKVIEISEWRDREIDVDLINDLIVDESLAMRVARIERELGRWFNRLPDGLEKLLPPLKNYHVEALTLLRQKLGDKLTFDTWDRKMMVLLMTEPERWKIIRATERLLDARRDAADRLSKELREMKHSDIEDLVKEVTARAREQAARQQIQAPIEAEVFDDASFSDPRKLAKEGIKKRIKEAGLG